MRLRRYRLSTLVTVFALSLISVPPATACTTFQIPNVADKVIGKSFDWHHNHGMLVVNKNKVEKKGILIKPTDKPHGWTSKYGSVTFDQVGRELPVSGINEAGLTIEIMVGGNKDPKQGDRPTLNELQWIQYQLDTYESVAEVIEHAGDIHISRVRVMVHYLICDKTGACGVVEFVDGALVTRAADQMVVNTLANDTYDDSVKELKKYKGFGGELPVPQSQDSLDRFVRATQLAKAYDAKVSLVDHAFTVLKSVFTPGRSVWNVVYEISKARVSYRTIENDAVRSVDVKSFDFSCKTKVTTLDVHQGRADVTKQFADYSYEQNQTLVDLSLKDAEAELPPGTLKDLGHYPETTICKE